MSRNKGRGQPPVSQQITRTAVSSQQFAGPIPPPSVMAQYGQIDSTFPERIMAMAEREQEHRQKREIAHDGFVRDQANREHEGGMALIASNNRRILIAGVVAGMLMVGAFVWVILRQTPESYFTLIGMLVTAVGAVVWNRFGDKKQLQEAQNVANPPASSAS